MSDRLVSAAGAAGSGHPLWHFAAVVAAPFVTFAAVRLHEGWKQRRSGSSPVTPLTLVVAVLGFAASAIHLSVCREHFREWVVYGIFFVAASVFQAAWSVLVLVRPSRGLFLLGAAANDGVVLLFIVSRTTGMPFGPEAFQPERLTTAGVAATVCELALVACACYRVRQLGSPTTSQAWQKPLPLPVWLASSTSTTAPLNRSAPFAPKSSTRLAHPSTTPFPGRHRRDRLPLPRDEGASPTRFARRAPAAASPQHRDPQ